MHNSTNSKKKDVIKVSSIQFKCYASITKNYNKATKLIIEASDKGAKIVLLQELFLTEYFCQEINSDYFKLSMVKNSNKLKQLSDLAAKLSIILIISFFEESNNVFFNSVVVFNVDGKEIGFYRKTHIPDGPGYEEKYYFSPGNIGIPVFETDYGKIGIGICWDQWFPEHARILALKGADIIFYPTAIGSEPNDPEYDSKPHWRRTIQGHSAANMIPIVVANRIGTETYNNSSINFYGSSFITDCFGKVICEASNQSEAIIYSYIDINKNKLLRNNWGIFRDRRPDLYKEILSMDGNID